MQLVEYLEEDYILPDLKSKSKTDVLKELLTPLSNNDPDFSYEKSHKILMERESLGSTGIGDGVAIPHGKMEDLEDIKLIVGRSFDGVDFAAIDNKPCYIFFLVLAPEQVAGLHLRILAQISRMVKDPEFRQTFMEVEGAKGIWDLLSSV